jgi:hypothetical protein
MAKLAVWFYGLSSYSRWALNALFLVVGVFLVGLLAFAMFVNNGEISNEDAPKNFWQFSLSVFGLGVFLSTVLWGLWALYSRFA